jgi:hypothetical protein
MVVRHLAEPDPGCQLLFIGSADPTVVGAALDATKGQAVVTVTDTNAARRGVISFVVVGNRVRFDIDDSLAAQGGISISSKLLGLARTVKQRGGQ